MSVRSLVGWSVRLPWSIFFYCRLQLSSGGNENKWDLLCQVIRSWLKVKLKLDRLVEKSVEVGGGGGERREKVLRRWGGGGWSGVGR